VDLAAAGLARQVTHTPIPSADEVFVFQAPAADAKELRLEVPTAAYGGAGMLKFAIPRSMIRSAPPAGRAAPKSKS
jgi:hypothetical protein